MCESPLKLRRRRRPQDPGLNDEPGAPGRLTNPAAIGSESWLNAKQRYEELSLGNAFSVIEGHPAGPSYIRVRSESVPANEQQFLELIARRNSVVNKILKYKWKWVTIVNSPRSNPRTGETMWPSMTTVFDCDQFGVTLATGDQPRDRQTFALERVELSFDHALDRLVIKLDR
jgi:hypothetical protein